MNSIMRNERGNASIYLIWMIFVMGLMLILILNIGKIFLTNQQASIGVEQASLAATAIVFDAVREAVDDYDEYQENKFYQTAEEGAIFPIERKLSYKIGKEEESLKHSGYTNNEAAIKAIDHIVTSHLPGEDDMLRSYVNHHLDGKKPAIRSEIASMLVQNDGETRNAKVTLFKEERGSYFGHSSFHIEVATTKTFKGTEFQSFFPPVTKDMDQIGIGPTIEFAKNLNRMTETFQVQ